MKKPLSTSRTRDICTKSVNPYLMESCYDKCGLFGDLKFCNFSLKFLLKKTAKTVTSLSQAIREIRITQCFGTVKVAILDEKALPKWRNW